MRIAYFTDTYLPQINGVSNTLEKLGAYLLDKNIEHMFFAPDYNEKIMSTANSPITRFKSVSLPFYPECRLSLPLYANLCQIADQFKPTIIHLTDPFGIGLAGLRYARDRGIPIVSSFHTNFDVYLKYYNLEYLEDIIWSFFKWFHRASMLNLCPSQDTLKILESKGLENLCIWSRGIDRDKFNPNQRSSNIRYRLKADDKLIFLYVGRMAVEKDLDILLDSIAIVNSSYADKVQFVFVGDGPYAKSIKERSYDNVVFTGYLRDGELAAMYASSDVFVFPSSTETFGNVVLEAMASGLPVIAVNSGGVKENVFHDYNGLMCAPRDTKSFTQAIIRLIEDKPLKETLAANAREHSAQKSWSMIFDQLVIDYGLVLKKSSSQFSKTA
ncbi:MAG: glycosyltransferase family 1 protein [Desulfosporosinus sp.]|nr:glycosyltransferase family 1 protein [Desulfosporosinus sp.]